MSVLTAMPTETLSRRNGSGFISVAASKNYRQFLDHKKNIDEKSEDDKVTNLNDHRQKRHVSNTPEHNLAEDCLHFVEGQNNKRSKGWSKAEQSRRAKFVEEVIERPVTLLFPRSWADAKAMLPNLKTWDEARTTADKPGFTIIDYLRDKEGLGIWTLHPPGLPRHLLRVLYSPIIEGSEQGSPYQALANWLKKENPETGVTNKLPDDMYLPTKKAETDRLFQEAGPTGKFVAKAVAAKAAREQRETQGKR